MNTNVWPLVHTIYYMGEKEHVRTVLFIIEEMKLIIPRIKLKDVNNF